MKEKMITKLPVPNEFKKEGLMRKLIKFESKGINDVAMYEVFKENWQYGTGHRGYEVMDIKYTKKDSVYYEKLIPAGTPLLPSNEQFGHSGWHLNSRTRAEQKFIERLNRPKPKSGRKPKEL